MSGWKPIVGLGNPVTIGNHILNEISKNNHPGSLTFYLLGKQARVRTLKIIKFASSMLQQAFFTFITVKCEKVEKG